MLIAGHLLACSLLRLTFCPFCRIDECHQRHRSTINHQRSPINRIVVCLLIVAKSITTLKLWTSANGKRYNNNKATSTRTISNCKGYDFFCGQLRSSSQVFHLCAFVSVVYTRSSNLIFRSHTRGHIIFLHNIYVLRRCTVCFGFAVLCSVVWCGTSGTNLLRLPLSALCFCFYCYFAYLLISRWLCCAWRAPCFSPCTFCFLTFFHLTLRSTTLRYPIRLTYPCMCALVRVRQWVPFAGNQVKQVAKYKMR